MRRARFQGFALPTVVITSTIMFAVLVAAVGVVSSTRASLDVQFYQGLATDAAESGAVRVSGCVLDGGMVAGGVVSPKTDCAGTSVSGQSAYEVNTPTYRTTYSATLSSTSAKVTIVDVVGKVERVRPTTGYVYNTVSFARKVSISLVLDPNGDRASQRYWYFGDRVIMDFGKTGQSLPTITRNASSSTPAPTATEGTTVVTDASGNLQFWSDGQTVWDKTGGIMQNSSGLLGGSSSTQAVASFPLNSSRTRYGIVSNSGQAETGPGQLYLSIVDLTLNGGKGAITTKNQQLGSTGYADEGLTAMPNSDGSGYYVYTYETTLGKITSFLVKTDGTVQGPFTTTFSPAPLICDPFTLTSPKNLTGYGTLNFTKDYKKLLVFTGARNCSDNAIGTVYIYSTEASTGALTLSTSWTAHADTLASGYSADFSPSEQYVYVTSLYPGTMARYNISKSSTIQASEWLMGSLTTDTVAANIRNSGGRVARGPDGRMYIADRSRYVTATRPCYISYIDTPDATASTAAAVGLAIDGLALPTNTCGVFGLPQMATVYKPKVLFY